MSAVTKSGKKLAEESQLLSEERWIVEAIKKIRLQRNCLQIERLQLESMLASQKMHPQVDTGTVFTENHRNSDENPTMILQNMQSSLDMVSASSSTGLRLTGEEHCNVETLNLSVSNPMRSNALMDNVNFVEEDEEEEEMENENDEMMIDMNMFMNSNVM